jgi:hypothetical protein
MEGRDNISWRLHKRDDRKVAASVRAGDIDTITGTGWGFLDKFFCFLYAVGFFDIVDIRSAGYQRIMLPLAVLITTYSVKILLGISSMNKIPALLFREIALLSLIGFTATQIKNGSCNRGKGKSFPINKNTLSRMLARLGIKETGKILADTASSVANKRFLIGTTYTMDATDIETTQKCAGCGKKTVKIRKFSRKEKKFVETEKTVYGFKLIVIWENISRVVVAAKVVKIADHESKHTLSLVRAAQGNIGKKKMRLLLIDNGFMDGKTLYTLKHKMGIDFIVRIRKNMQLAGDARGLKGSSGIYEAEDKAKGLEVTGIPRLTTYDQYGKEGHDRNRYKKIFSPNPINCVMVTRWGGKKYKDGDEKIFATSLDVSEPLFIIEKYSLRSLIENVLFRELKQGWNLERIPMKKKSAVVSHIMLTLVIYSLNACFQTDRGRSLTSKGIRRLRDEDMSTIHKLIVFSGDYFAIFDVEEYAIIVRAPPKTFFRIDPDEARRRLGLKD